jgi:hypothetical protein
MYSLRPVKTQTVPLPPAGAAQRAKRNVTPSGVPIVPASAPSGTGLAGSDSSVMAPMSRQQVGEEPSDGSEQGAGSQSARSSAAASR